MLFIQLYNSPLNIRIVLTEVITWTTVDRITISSDPETLLNTFRNNQRSVISSLYDSAMLITCVNIQMPYCWSNSLHCPNLYLVALILMGTQWALLLLAQCAVQQRQLE